MKANETIKWHDAQKRHPKKGKTVFTLSKLNEKGKFSYGLCHYKDGAYWAVVTGRCYTDGHLVNKIDYEYIVENVVCWIDPLTICQEAEDILYQVKWEE